MNLSRRMSALGVDGFKQFLQQKQGYGTAFGLKGPELGMSPQIETRQSSNTLMEDSPEPQEALEFRKRLTKMMSRKMTRSLSIHDNQNLKETLSVVEKHQSLLSNKGNEIKSVNNDER